MGNLCSVDNKPHPVDPAMLTRYEELARHADTYPGSLCVVVHDLAKLFVADHAVCHVGGAPVDAIKIDNHAIKQHWWRAESGIATQEEWQALSGELHQLDKQANRRQAYQRIGHHGKSPLFTAVHCANKALEFGEHSDALESLQLVLLPGEETTVRSNGFIKTYYKTDEDFLGMYPPVRDPGARVHLDPR